MDPLSPNIPRDTVVTDQCWTRGLGRRVWHKEEAEGRLQIQNREITKPKEMVWAEDSQRAKNQTGEEEEGPGSQMAH